MLLARRRVRERALGTREVDENVTGPQRRGNVRAHVHIGATTDTFAGIATDERTVRDVKGSREREVGLRERRLDECLAHPAAGTGDRDANAHRLPFSMSMKRSHAPLSPAPGSGASARSAAIRLSCAAETGSSSPSQRASLSSAKYALNFRCSTFFPCRVYS